MRNVYLVQTRAPVELTDAERLALIAERFRLVDATTGDVEWEPGAGGADALAEALDRWIGTGQTVAVDPADPLSYLLAGCRCVPSHRIVCPVHGRALRPRFQARQRLRARHSAWLDRRQAIREHYAGSGSASATARAFGITPQRVRQIAEQDRAPAPAARPSAPEVGP